MQTGGCLCGEVRYTLEGPAMFQFACHCRACQHATGGSPTYGLVVPKAAVTITRGEVRKYESAGDNGDLVERCFCGVCGSPLFSYLGGQPDVMVVKVGSLDDPSSFAVQGDMWMDAAQPWHRAHKGAATFAGNPGG